MNVWRERLSRWFSPLAARIALSPNAITIVAFALNAVAAALLYSAQWQPRLFLTALGVIAVGGLADALDGIVARVQGKASRYGDFLDHFFDRASDLVVAAGWMLGSGVRPELALGGTIAVMLNGYAGTQMEATWHEREYETIGRGEFVLALIVFPLVSYILASNGWSAVEAGGLRVAEWMTVALALFALIGIAQRFRHARALERSE